MDKPIRIGLYSFIDEVFWIQVAESVKLNVPLPGVNLIELDVQSFQAEDRFDPFFVEDVFAQDLDALICADLAIENVVALLNRGLPVINLSESSIRHPLICSPVGLYGAANLLGNLIVEQLNGKGNLLLVGGIGYQNDNTSRLNGLRSAFQRCPGITYQHLATPWSFEPAFRGVYPQLQNLKFIPDAIIGLSDTVALATRDAAESLGLLQPSTLIAGINGDPLALVAILEGRMFATVETSAYYHGKQALELALQAARGQPLPEHFEYKIRLVNRENISDAAREKLISLADYPNRLLGENRARQAERILQLESILQVLQKAEQILKPSEFNARLPDLIKRHLEYSEVFVYRYDEENHRFLNNLNFTGSESQLEISDISRKIFSKAIQRSKPIFIPSTKNSSNYPFDPSYPDTYSRVILPIHLGRKITGILDAHSRNFMNHLPDTLIQLQLLADQLGTISRNIELYDEVKKSQKETEKANQLKTRSIATISHELRTPLDIILGAVQALKENEPVPDENKTYLETVGKNAEHLTRIANDLLDLSRAEINQLELNLEICDIRPIILDSFSNIQAFVPIDSQVRFYLRLPDRLPLIKADPVRLKQILLNLLHNATKFTHQGEIILNTEVGPAEIHIEIKDTGPGIPSAIKNEIFEPFVSARPSVGDREGTGLGLAITRSLVLLHQGKISVESEVGKGTSFIIDLPIPSIGDQEINEASKQGSALLIISTKGILSDEIYGFCKKQHLNPVILGDAAAIENLVKDLQPAAVAWDVGSAGMEDWLIVQKVRASPELNKIPFFLFSYDEEAKRKLVTTNVIIKPVIGSNLAEYINAIRPELLQGPILIIDDDPLIRQAYQDLIKTNLPGFETLLANSGKSAIQYIQNIVPSLVILDLVMPEMDGFDVLDWVRSNPATRNVPVIVISGHALTQDDVAKIGRHAQVIFHTKGILTQPEMANALKNALGGKNARLQSASLWVKLALTYIQQSYDQPISRQDLARAVGLTENYLTRIFQAELGLAPWDYLARYRIERAKELLLSTHETITYIATRTGFDDPAYFSRVFKKYTGTSPNAFRNKS
jgi:signal transduction histidine kinase/AraC-like DNA-binding protein/ABC-type sugar transport system substrate-binding protein